MNTALSNVDARAPGRWSLLSQAWAGFRPRMSQETLALLTGMFLTVFSNAAFFRAVHASGSLHGIAGVGSAVCLFVFVAALNTLLALLLFNRWSTKPVLAVLLPATAAAAYYMDRYGVYFDTDMVRNVLQTDMHEATELLSFGLAARILLAGAIPAALAWRIELVRKTPARAILVRTGAVALAIAVAAGAALASFQSLSAVMRNHHEIRHLLAPGNYLVSLGRVLADDGRVSDTPRKELGAGAHVVGRRPDPRPRLLVLVVGETARARNWGLNGYDRQTTPQLARMDLVNFTDVSSCGTSTAVSLPCMFSPHARADYDKSKVRNSESLLHVLAHAGIQVTWLDNQGGCKGVCTGLDYRSYAHEDDPEFCDAEGCLDGILVKGLAERIASLEGDAVIVLHPLGNHGPAYHKRYPQAFAKFLPACESPELGDCSRDQVLNAYDNALLYTDDVLARAIRLLGEQTGKDTALLYLSDHGESLGEGGLYLHGMPYSIAPEEQKKVPMTMWLSPGYSGSLGLDVACLKEKAATASVSHDNYFHTVLGLMRVWAPEYRAGMDLLEGCRAGRGEPRQVARADGPAFAKAMTATGLPKRTPDRSRLAGGPDVRRCPPGSPSGACAAAATDDIRREGVDLEFGTPPLRVAEVDIPHAPVEFDIGDAAQTALLQRQDDPRQWHGVPRREGHEVALAVAPEFLAGDPVEIELGADAGPLAHDDLPAVARQAGADRRSVLLDRLEDLRQRLVSRIRAVRRIRDEGQEQGKECENTGDPEHCLAPSGWHRTGIPSVVGILPDTRVSRSRS